MTISVSLLLLTATASTCLAQSAEFIRFPQDFRPLGISADGQVVVGLSGYPIRPARWTQAQGVTQLTGPAGQLFGGKAWAANDDGSVIVGTYLPAGTGSEPRAFRWTAGSGLVAIPDVAGVNANGYAVSADGTVVVGSGRIGTGPNTGYYWKLGVGTLPLPFPGQAISGYAGAISADGRFATGHAVSSDHQSMIVRWDLMTGSVEDWNNIFGTHLGVEGFDINGDGQAIVGKMDGPAGTVTVLVTTAGIETLVTPPGFHNASPWAMTPDARWVVGQLSTLGSGIYSPFIFSQGLGMTLLKPWLQSEWNLDLSHTQMAQATAISADGRTIVGYTDSTYAGWLVRLPVERPADFNADSTVDFMDFNDFMSTLRGQVSSLTSSADLNHDGFTDFFDLDYFLENF